MPVPLSSRIVSAAFYGLVVSSKSPKSCLAWLIPLLADALLAAATSLSPSGTILLRPNMASKSPRRGHNVPDVALLAEDLPCVAELAAAFASARRGRAAGLSGLSADLFRLSNGGRRVPLQFTGGLAHMIPKGDEAPAPPSWRSIMLLESDAKSLQRAFRPRLMDCFRVARTSGQFGGVPGCQLSLPSFLVRCHFLNLKAARQSGGVLFMDCRSAYCSVVCDFLCLPSGLSDRSAFLHARADILFQHSEVRQQFVQFLSESDILSRFGAPARLRRFVAATFQDTWFVTDRTGDTAWLTKSGTAPGSPIADILFGLVFASFLRDLELSLARDGCCVQLLQEKTCCPVSSNCAEGQSANE